MDKVHKQELMVSQHEELKDQKGLKSSIKELQQLKKSPNNFYDYEKIRRTIIKGIPCN